MLVGRINNKCLEVHPSYHFQFRILHIEFLLVVLPYLTHDPAPYIDRRGWFSHPPSVGGNERAIGVPSAMLQPLSQSFVKVPQCYRMVIQSGSVTCRHLVRTRPLARLHLIRKSSILSLKWPRRSGKAQPPRGDHSFTITA